MKKKETEECNVIFEFVPEDDPDLQNLDVNDSNWEDEEEGDIEEEVGNSMPQTAGTSRIINSSDGTIWNTTPQKTFRAGCPAATFAVIWQEQLKTDLIVNVLRRH